MMMILSFLGMCFLDYVMGKIVDGIGDCILIAIAVPTMSIAKIGQPFAGALR